MFSFGTQTPPAAVPEVLHGVVTCRRSGPWIPCQLEPLAVSPFTLMLPWLVTSRQRGVGPGTGAARFTNRETKARPDPPLDAPCRLALSIRVPWPEVML